MQSRGKGPDGGLGQARSYAFWLKPAYYYVVTAGDYFTVWIYQGGAVPDVRVIEVRRSHAARAVRRAVRGAQPGGGPGSPAAEDRAPGRNPAGPLMAGPRPCRVPASLTPGPSQVAAGGGPPPLPRHHPAPH